MSIWILHFDGLCEPQNPSGVMGCGWTLQTDKEFLSDGFYFPAQPANTNNIAEYCAAGCGLKRLVRVLTEIGPWGCDGIEVRGDSQLVINQITGKWGSKTEHLTKLRDRCLELIAEIKKLSGHNPKMVWIGREENGAADNLSREAYQKLTGELPPERRKREKTSTNF